jgi:hypothetical protein
MHQNSSKAYRRLRSYHHIIETKFKERTVKREKKENENNLIEKDIITNHYSCLEVGSLVQVQFNPGLKCSSGSQRIRRRNSSKAYRRLQSYHRIIETKVYGKVVKREEKEEIKLQEVKSQENVNSYQNTRIILNLVPKIKSKSEEEEKENENNLIEKYIITNHYSCLEVSSLVQDQFNPGLKCSSGSQRIKRQNSSKAYRRLRSYHYIIETKVNEQELRRKRMWK